MCDPAAANNVYTAQVTGAEAAAAIMRRVRRGEGSGSGAATAIADLQLHLRRGYTGVVGTDALVQRAIDLVQRHPLRGYNAIQLASALRVRDDCLVLGIPGPIFVSADAALNAAAFAEGLAVEDPNAHR